MSNIPTAEEFWLKNNGQLQSGAKMMIEFAKLHVEAALQASAEQNYPSIKSNSEFINKRFLNAYPLTNIK